MLAQELFLTYEIYTIFIHLSIYFFVFLCVAVHMPLIETKNVTVLNVNSILNHKVSDGAIGGETETLLCWEWQRGFGLRKTYVWYPVTQ